jgi:hypothetical protein
VILISSTAARAFEIEVAAFAALQPCTDPGAATRSCTNVIVFEAAGSPLDLRSRGSFRMRACDRTPVDE